MANAPDSPLTRRTQSPVEPAASSVTARPHTRDDRRPKARQGIGRRLRLKLRNALRSRFAVRAAGFVVFRALRFVHRTQKPVAGSSPWRETLKREAPAIVGLWHGQHLLAPFFQPEGMRFVALLSKNADAEINADVVRRFGVDTVRGSGGRGGPGQTKKGGAKALIALRRELGAGKSVCMIADIPKGTPRDAGLGIVTLARISGRPILPSAAITSRRYVVRGSWDKTTVPLPFGRIAVVVGEPIHVAPDADEAEMEKKRLETTQAIEAANRAAERLVTGNPA